MFKEDLINNLHELYRNDPYINSIFNAAGITLDNLADNIQDVLNQYDFTKMTWNIPIMEKILDFKTNSNTPIEDRRAQLQARWKSNSMAKAQLFKSIASSWVNGECDVSFISGQIQITFISKNGLPKDLEIIYKAMEDVKPAHLPIFYKLISTSKMNLYFGAATLYGEVVTVYPWGNAEIETSGTINIGSAPAINAETTIIYPKEAS